MCHPVMAKPFETPLTVTVRSIMPGCAARLAWASVKLMYQISSEMAMARGVRARRRRSRPFRLRIHAPRRVVRRIDHHDPGLLRQRGPQLVCGHLEILLNAGLHRHDSAPGQVCHVGIAHPERGGEDDLVSWIDQARRRSSSCAWRLWRPRFDPVRTRVHCPATVCRRLLDALLHSPGLGVV